MNIIDRNTGVEIEPMGYEAVYVSVVVRDPAELSAVALVGVENRIEKALPEDQIMEQYWNRTTAYPLLHVDGLQYIQNETIESVLTRASRSLDNDYLYLVNDKNLIVGINEIGPEPVIDLSIEHTVEMVLTGGQKMGYDDDGIYTVPLRDIVTALVSTYGRQGIQTNRNMEYSESFDQQLMSLSLGQDELETMLLAVGIAVWRVGIEHKRETMFAEDNRIDQQDDILEWGLPE